MFDSYETLSNPRDIPRLNEWGLDADTWLCLDLQQGHFPKLTGHHSPIFMPYPESKNMTGLRTSSVQQLFAELLQ